MKKQKESSIAQAGGEPVAGESEAAQLAQPVYQQIKLALDVRGSPHGGAHGGWSKAAASPEDVHRTLLGTGGQKEVPSPGGDQCLRKVALGFLAASTAHCAGHS